MGVSINLVEEKTKLLLVFFSFSNFINLLKNFPSFTKLEKQKKFNRSGICFLFKKQGLISFHTIFNYRYLYISDHQVAFIVVINAPIFYTCRGSLFMYI